MPAKAAAPSLPARVSLRAPVFFAPDLEFRGRKSPCSRLTPSLRNVDLSEYPPDDVGQTYRLRRLGRPAFARWRCIFRATPARTPPATTLPARTLPASTAPATTLPALTAPATTLPALTAPATTLPAGTPPARHSARPNSARPNSARPNPARPNPARPNPARRPCTRPNPARRHTSTSSSGPHPRSTSAGCTSCPDDHCSTRSDAGLAHGANFSFSSSCRLGSGRAGGTISASVRARRWVAFGTGSPHQRPTVIGVWSSSPSPFPLVRSPGIARTAGTVSPAGSLAGSWRPQGRPISGPEYRIWRNNSGVFAGTPSSFQPSAITREPRGAPPNAVPPGANTLRRSELPLGVRPLFVPFPPAYPSKWVEPALTTASGPSAVTTRSPLMPGGGGAPGPGVAVARSLPHAISVVPPRISRVSQPILATTTTATVGRGTSPNIRGAPWPTVSGSPAHTISRQTTPPVSPIVRPTFGPAATPAVQRARASFSPSTSVAVDRDVRTPAHQNVPARAHQNIPGRTHQDVRRAAFPRVPAPAFPGVPSSVLPGVPAPAFPSGQSPAILRAPAASSSKSATPPLASSLATAICDQRRRPSRGRRSFAWSGLLRRALPRSNRQHLPVQ